jgi:hypothetical protein
MLHRFRRALTLAVAASALLVTGALPAAAITGGVPDENQHPNVALIVYYTEEGRFRCSATLVSPTVLLTAGHCTDGVIGSVAVTFDTAPAPEPPFPLPPAADPSVGYTDAEIAAAGFLSGTAFTYPGYSGFTDLSNWNDVGVIVLDQPVTGIQPATIAEPGTLDAYPQPRLNRTVFTLVGYGTEVRKPEAGPQKPTPLTYPLIRRTTTAVGQKLTEQIIQLNGNPNDVRGGGGSCFGDSGGPLFLNGQIVGVSSYVYNGVCRYLLGYQRVDIPEIQEWLAGFGVPVSTT